MKKSVKITLIVSVVLIIVGLLFAGIGLLCGARLSIYNEGFGFFVDSGERIHDENPNLERFDSIDIDVGMSRVEIISGSSYAVETEFYGESRKITYTVENGVLTVRGGGKRSFGISLGNFKNKFNNVKVYVPETELKKLSVKTGMGDVTVKAVMVRELECINNMGETELENVTAESSHLKLDMGSLHVSGSSLGNASVENAMGDFVGRNITTDSLICDMNMGEVDISGALNGATTVNADMGEVKLALGGAESDYNFNIVTDAGTVYFNGNSEGSSFKNACSAANTVDVNNNMGSVRITFK